MIKIEKITPVVRGCVTAEIDISVEKWKLTIRKIQECVKDGRRWFNWPSFSEEVDGKKVWEHYMVFHEQEHHKQFFETIRQKVDEMRANNRTNFSDDEGVPF